MSVATMSLAPLSDPQARWWAPTPHTKAAPQPPTPTFNDDNMPIACALGFVFRRDGADASDGRSSQWVDPCWEDVDCAFSGYTDAISDMIARGEALHEPCGAALALRGHDDVLIELHAATGAWPPHIAAAAAFGGQVETLRRVVSAGCPFDVEECADFSRRGGRRVAEMLSTLESLTTSH